MPKSKSKRKRKAETPKGIDPHVLDEVVAELAERMAEDPKAFAAELIEDAWHEPNDELRGDMALQAMQLDPGCSDALIILANLLEPGSDKAIELAENAIRLAEENMGERPFERFAGQFWEAQETRPYLRARSLLIDNLRARQDWTAVEDHLRALLELWPKEHAGCRFLLLRLLFDADKLDEAERLVARYREESSAVWIYGRALLAFKREGHSLTSESHLRFAMAINGYAPHYLLELYRLPADRPDSPVPGTRAEAQVYAYDFLDCWKATPGALQWLQEAQSRKSKA